MKILKILVALTAGVVLMVGGGVAYIAATFDPNAYKPQIIQLVKDKRQRTLKLEGDIKLKFWPSVGADLGRLSLSEFKSEAEFATVDNARLSLKLLPLLSRKVVVDEVVLRGARATVIKRKDGTLNIDDLLAKDDQKSGAVEFDIDHVNVENAALVFRNEKDRATWALSNLNVKTGRIVPKVPGKVETSFTVRGDKPKTDIALTLKTRLTFDLEQQIFALQELALEAKGQAADVRGATAKASGNVTAKLKAGELTTSGLSLSFSGNSGSDQFDVRLDSPKLLITKEKMSGDKVTINARVNSAKGLTTARLELPGLDGTGQAFRAAIMTLDIESKQGEQNIKASVRSPLSGNLQAQQINLPKLAVSIQASGPNVPGRSLTGALNGSASLQGAKQLAQAQLAGKVGASAIKAHLAVNGFAPPGLNFDIDIDQLDVDQYAPPAGGGASAGTGGAGGAAPDKPIDVSALRMLRANGKVRIGVLKASNIRANAVRLDIRAVGGQVDVSPMSANLYEGAMTGALSLNAAGAVPRMAVRQNLSGVAIGPLLKDLANKDSLEGKGSVTLDVTTQGATVGALKRALAGNAAVYLRDGAIKGIDIAGTIRDARAKVGALKGQQTQAADKAKKTDFSELSGTFAIQGGVARNNDLSLKSPLLRVTGEGDINIGEDTVNYLVKAAIVGTLRGQDGRDMKDLTGVTVPVRVSGPLTAPSYALDFNAMLTDTVKQKAEEVVRGKLEDAIFGKKPAAPPTGKGEASKSGRDSATDVLKGIFGR